MTPQKQGWSHFTNNKPRERPTLQTKGLREMKTDEQGRVTHYRRLGMVIIAFTGLLIANGWENNAATQQGDPVNHVGFERNKNRKFGTDDLVNQLRDSQSDYRELRTRERRHFDGGRNRGINPAKLSSRDLRSLRLLLSDFADQSSVLTRAIDDERRRVPSVRAYFSDALKIRARAYYASQQAEKTESPYQIAQDYREVDQDFRLLSSGLRQVRGLSRAVSRPVIAMEKIDKEITGMLKIRPQLNYVKLSRQCASLSAGFRNLLEDIKFELPRSTNRTELLSDGRRLSQQAEYLASIASDRASHADVSREYKRFSDLWKPYSNRLRNVNNRYVERNARRINQSNRDVRELLWLPHQVDRTQLVHLTKMLMKDVDEFFTRAPLKLLINLPRRSSVLTDSSEFYKVCENFVKNVNAGDKNEDLIEDFNDIENSFRLFHETFHEVKSQKAHTVMSEVASRIQSLRRELKVQDGYFDRNEALELAAAIDNLASRMNSDVDRWIGRSDSAIARQARRDSTDFVKASHTLNLDIERGKSIAKISDQADHLFELWGTLHKYIPRADEETRFAMQRTSARLTPYLVDLQTMLGSQRGLSRTNNRTGNRDDHRTDHR